MAAYIFGLVGAGGAVLIAGMWYGAALLFGFSPPTADQFGGMVILLGSGGVIVGGVLQVIYS